jgi:hypothetical protein
VVTASRDWICVRPATYESAAEAEVLLSYFEGHQGTLENTVFALLDSRGKLLSFRSGRSPSMLYDGPEEFAQALNKHGKTPRSDSEQPLPRVENLRLGLNVAACDSLPLVVGFAPSQKERDDLSRRLATSAWQDDVAGEAHYVVCAPEDLDEYPELAKERGQERSGILVLDPDDYGRSAQVLNKVDQGLAGRSLTSALKKGLSKHSAVVRDHRDHVRTGKRKGYEWKGKIETTDPTEKRRSKRERRKK